MSPTLHVTVWPFVVQLFEVPVIVNPAGTVSLIWTLVAVAFPTLEASIVNVTVSPEVTFVELALFVTFTSGLVVVPPTVQHKMLLLKVPVPPADGLPARSPRTQNVSPLLTDAGTVTE